MSGAPVSRNPAKVRPRSNQSRPGGASRLAASDNPSELLLAMETGNRQTRRLAKRNALRLLKKHERPA